MGYTGKLSMCTLQLEKFENQEDRREINLNMFKIPTSHLKYVVYTFKKDVLYIL